MAQPLDVKHLLATGKEFTDSGRSQARQLGIDLVSGARQATEQIAAMIDDLAGRWSRERIEELRQVVRDDVQHEFATLRDSMRAELARGRVAVDRIEVMLNELDSHRREQQDELRESVRDELQHRLNVLGVATRDDIIALGRTLRDDLSALEQRLERAAGSTTENKDEIRVPDALRATPPYDEPPTT